MTFDREKLYTFNCDLQTVLEERRKIGATAYSFRTEYDKSVNNTFRVLYDYPDFCIIHFTNGIGNYDCPKHLIVEYRPPAVKNTKLNRI